MTETTHTTAGLLAHAGAARLRVAARGVPVHEVFGRHQSASWTEGTFAIPTTLMVIDAKNRPSRPLLERSP